MEHIKQGDSYLIPVYIQANGQPLNISDVTEIEFTLGNTSKLYPGKVEYDETNNRFLYPLSQEESFLFRPPLVTMDVRVKMLGTNVVGGDRKSIEVIKALSRQVL